MIAGRRRMFGFFTKLKSDRGGLYPDRAAGGDFHHRRAVGDGAGGNDRYARPGAGCAAAKRYYPNQKSAGIVLCRQWHLSCKKLDDQQ